jgi:hypothetical protein
MPYDRTRMRGLSRIAAVGLLLLLLRGHSSCRRQQDGMTTAAASQPNERAAAATAVDSSPLIETWLGRRMRLAIVCSALLLPSIFLLEHFRYSLLGRVGIHHWRLMTRPVEPEPYAIYLGTITSVFGVLLALYYTFGATFFASFRPDQRSQAIRQLLADPWVVPPAVSVAVGLALLSLSPLGLRPYHAAYPILAVLGVLSLVSIAILGAHVGRVPAIISADSPLDPNPP